MDEFRSHHSDEKEDHLHLYGQACNKTRFLLYKIKRKVIIKNLLLISALLLAFSAGVAFQLALTGRNLHDSIQLRRYQHFQSLTQQAPVPPTDTSPQPPFPAPENTTYRQPDTLNTFSTYLYANHPACSISSLSLHKAFAPLCRTRQSFLTAFSGGGRIGFNAPFMSRDCDMRWFTTEEICEVMGRFERVVVVGDSMMRHVVGALNVLLRRDLGYGAVTGWNFGEEEMRDCFCTHQMDVKSCSVQGIFSTSSVLEHDPSSFACSSSSSISTSNSHLDSSSQNNPVDLTIEMMVKFPLVEEELLRFTNLLSPTKPRRPYAFILGHGLWNDLDLALTMKWIEGVLRRAAEKAPYLGAGDAGNRKAGGGVWPVLFIPPNAAGVKKSDTFLVTQGDKALQVFERSVGEELARWSGEDDTHTDDTLSSSPAHSIPRPNPGPTTTTTTPRRRRISTTNFLGGRSQGPQIDVLGTYNMSIQADKYDGVHMDLRGNLVKAMGVVNWLSMIDVEAW